MAEPAPFRDGANVSRSATPARPVVSKPNNLASVSSSRIAGQSADDQTKSPFEELVQKMVAAHSAPVAKTLQASLPASPASSFLPVAEGLPTPLPAARPVPRQLTLPAQKSALVNNTPPHPITLPAIPPKLVSLVSPASEAPEAPESTDTAGADETAVPPNTRTPAAEFAPAHHRNTQPPANRPAPAANGAGLHEPVIATGAITVPASPVHSVIWSLLRSSPGIVEADPGAVKTGGSTAGRVSPPEQLLQANDAALEVSIRLTEAALPPGGDALLPEPLAKTAAPPAPSLSRAETLPGSVLRVASPELPAPPLPPAATRSQDKASVADTRPRDAEGHVSGLVTVRKPQQNERAAELAVVSDALPHDAAPLHSSSLPGSLIAEDAGRRTEPASPHAAGPRETAPAPATNYEMPAERPEATQPLRKLSLEFTPDGANDIRLRVQERAGAVHISLHSSDPSLAGRLHEGIHDLVGSLSTAGYDAEAWTPNQGRQNQRAPDDSPKGRRRGTSGSAAEDFSGILQQPTIEEIK